MASILASEHDFVWKFEHSPILTQRFYQVLVPFGRLLFSFIFIVAGFNHFSQASIAYAEMQGVPAPDFFVPFSGMLALAGGLSILFGYRPRIGALFLILFLVPVTLVMHQFWVIPDPVIMQVQLGNFMKNLSMIGAAVIIFFFGAGPFTVESWLAKKHENKPAT